MFSLVRLESNPIQICIKIFPCFFHLVWCIVYFLEWYTVSLTVFISLLMLFISLNIWFHSLMFLIAIVVLTYFPCCLHFCIEGIQVGYTFTWLHVDWMEDLPNFWFFAYFSLWCNKARNLYRFVRYMGKGNRALLQ